MKAARSVRSRLVLSPRWQYLAVLAVLLLGGMTVQPASANDRYAALVIDAVSGEVLHEENASQRRYPASLTKMMTLYLTFKALEEGRLTLHQKLTVSRAAAAQPPSALGLPPGSRIEVEDAILALVTKSANDIAVVLAEAIGGSESRFAQAMTEQARWLDMRNTVFRNASGLPNSGQYTTAWDMARLAQALMRDYPQYYHYFSTRSFTYRGRTYRNHNGLLGRYEGMDGLKTGYIHASGFNLAASVERGGLRLIGIVFGGRSAASRNERMVELLDAAFAGRRGQYLVAHGSQPFRPPLPARRPGETYAITVASVLAPDQQPTTLVVPAAAQAAAARPVLAVAEDVPLAPLPPALPVNLRPDLQILASLPAEPASIIGGDLSTEELWSIQVGAYDDAETSREVLDRIAEELPHLMLADSQVIEVATQRGDLYRARFVGLDYAGAVNACKELSIRGTDCLPIAPDRDF